jgi:hypothetical protein
MRRRLIVSLVPTFVLFVGCGDDASNEFDTVTTQSADSGTATDTGALSDLPETGGMEAEGDGDGDPATGDGDGDPTTTTGDGDGDPTTGDGDGDTGVGECGDGVVNVGEQCDGDDLNGFTCADLGYAGGELACDPVTCTYDASNCMTDMEGGSGGTTG